MRPSAPTGVQPVYIRLGEHGEAYKVGTVLITANGSGNLAVLAQFLRDVADRLDSERIADEHARH